MNLSFKEIGLTVVLAAAACDSDKPLATEQAAVEDSALALSVMTAKGDTLTAPFIEPFVEPPPKPAVTQRPSIAAVPQRTETQPPPPSTTVAALPIMPVPKATAALDIARRPAVRVETKSAATEERAGIVAKGSALSLVTSETLCSGDASVGSSVSARVVSSVRGSNGAMIPEGAHATAEVTSMSEWGAGIGLRVTSVRFNGRSYPLKSNVGYIIPENSSRGVCIPKNTRLEAEIASPLKVLALN